MSTHYDTEPPPTAAATLHTTVGPIHISLFARQTPLACKNFLQHCLDGYYEGTTFHRVVPDFIIQGGDPTGTGSGGSSIYEYPEFEYDPRDGEKVVFKDEFHSRLRFNRRGLVGMAKSEDGTYGSQFFITLANAQRELDKTCTMFGRVEGDSIYKVASIAEAELVEGSDRPVYAVKITGCEVDQLGPFEGQLKRRERIAVADSKPEEAPAKGKKKKKAKVGKALLSFAGDEDEGESIVPTKPKFNTKLVREEEEAASVAKKQAQKEEKREKDIHKPEPSPAEHPVNNKKTTKPTPRVPDPNTQLPLPDAESPSRPTSPSSSASESPPPRSRRQSLLSKTNAEIAALKASMKRSTAAAPAETARKKSALESLIPETSIRGARKRAGAAGNPSQDAIALDMFNAFKAKLENADTTSKKSKRDRNDTSSRPEGKKTTEQQRGEQGEEEEQVCDLHFVAGCLSCRSWDVPKLEGAEAADDDDTGWMTHTLQFGKDTLGKDLNWKRAHQENDDLVVIDPRQKEKEITGGGGKKRERERKRKLETGQDREWDRRDAKKSGSSRP